MVLNLNPICVRLSMKKCRGDKNGPQGLRPLWVRTVCNLIKISCSIYCTAMNIAVAYIEQLFLIRLELYDIIYKERGLTLTYINHYSLASNA